MSTVDGINRALNYITNEDKIGGFISGYLCDPETCECEFRNTKIKNLKRVGKSLSEDKGNYYYHIIQSFPEGLDIPDEEVHHCGVELVKRLGLYQAVVASHIHPAIDEEGEVHGRCKHNHIIINSHIYHEFVDENNPHKMKYNDCNETYEQLQLINDQIAIEHGLPIIDKPDKGKVYSWFEAKEKNEGISWKARVKIDISNAMRVSENLDDFLISIQAAGYQVRFGNSKSHGKYIRYTYPENEHIVRDYILGKGFTISDLNEYWKIRKAIKEGIETNREKPENKIQKLLEETSQPLSIKFKKQMSDRRKDVLREKHFSTRTTYTNYLPLTTHKLYSESELSYFDSNQTYEIVDVQHRKVMDVSGQDILDYFNILYQIEEEKKRDEEKRRKEDQEKSYYRNPSFIQTSNHRPYEIRMYDEFGCKRTLIELIIILAMVTIENEYGKWQAAKSPIYDAQEYENNPIYARKDWKTQNMVDTIRIAREENIQNPTELEEKINQTGKDLSKSRAEVRRLTGSMNKMEVIRQAIEGYREVKELCERIHEMPDGPEKISLQSLHAEEIEEYKYHRATMYRHNISSEEDILDFKERYEQIKKNLQRAEEQEETYSNTYSRLNRLKYNIQLAQNRQYCYGPAFKDFEVEVTQEYDIPDTNPQCTVKKDSMER